MVNEEINRWTARRSPNAYTGSIGIRKGPKNKDVFKYRNSAEKNAVMLFEGSPDVERWAKAPLGRVLRWSDPWGCAYETQVGFEVEFAAKKGMLTLVIFAPGQIELWDFERDLRKHLSREDHGRGYKTDFYKRSGFQELPLDWLSVQFESQEPWRTTASRDVTREFMKHRATDAPKTETEIRILLRRYDDWWTIGDIERALGRRCEHVYGAIVHMIWAGKLEREVASRTLDMRTKVRLPKVRPCGA